MVFNSPTSVDFDNATLISFERRKLASFNHFLKIMPHIFSHVDVEIRLNQNLSLQTPGLFENSIYVRLIGTRMFCSQVKCNGYYPRGESCTDTSTPFVFKSGNSDISACEASCFNIYNGAKDDKGQTYKAPLTSFSTKQDCCLVHVDSYYRLGFDDYMRTDEHTTPRIDTIGTGYDLDDEPYIDAQGNETFHYKLNKYYCDDFNYEFKGTHCEPSTQEKIFSILGSENLYKGVQYGVRKIGSGVGLSGVQKVSLPPIEKAPPDTFLQWKSRVNSKATFFNVNLKLSDLGITKDNSHLIFTTRYGWPGRLVEPLILYDEINPKPNVTVVDYSNGKNLLPQYQYDEYGRRYFDEYEIIGSYSMLREANRITAEKLEDLSDDDAYIANENKLRDLIDALSKQILTAEFWEAIAINLGSVYISIMKRLAQFAETQFTKITKTMMFVAQKTIFNSIVHTGGALALKFSATAFRLLASTFKMLSVVGMVLDILGLIDIALLGADIFDLKNLVGQEAVDLYSRLDLESNRLAYGYKSVEFSPAYFIALYDTYNRPDISKIQDVEMADNIVLLSNAFTATLPYQTTVDNVISKDDVLQSFIWESEYLQRLVKNSNGIDINWSDSNGIELTSFNELADNVFSKSPTSYVDYAIYSRDFVKRVNILSISTASVIFLVLINLFIVKSEYFTILVLIITTFIFTIATTPNLIQLLFPNDIQ